MRSNNNLLWILLIVMYPALPVIYVGCESVFHWIFWWSSHLFWFVYSVLINTFGLTFKSCSHLLKLSVNISKYLSRHTVIQLRISPANLLFDLGRLRWSTLDIFMQSCWSLRAANYFVFKRIRTEEFTDSEKSPKKLKKHLKMRLKV